MGGKTGKVYEGRKWEKSTFREGEQRKWIEVRVGRWWTGKQGWCKKRKKVGKRERLGRDGR